SDLDFVVICRDEHQPELLREAPAFAARLGPLLAWFTGEHVGEPRLLITLYGPPPLHVDLKFVADADLGHRGEDGRILWQRGGRGVAGGRAGLATPGSAVDRGPLLGLGPLRRGQARPRRIVRMPRHARRPARHGLRAAHRAGPWAPGRWSAAHRADGARPGT